MKDFVENLKNFIGFHWKSNQARISGRFLIEPKKLTLELEDDTECIANCVLIE